MSPIRPVGVDFRAAAMAIPDVDDFVLAETTNEAKAYGADADAVAN